MTFIILILWIVFSVAIAKRAKLRGRSAFGWFCLSFFLSPVIGICLLIILPERWESPQLIEASTIEARKRQGGIALLCSLAAIVVLFVFAFALA